MKNTIFICQFTGDFVKVARCSSDGAKREITAAELIPVSPAENDSVISEKLGQVFKKLGFNNGRIIVSLPRGLATCRYLKIPSSSPEEIRRILPLQAPRYLPYAIEELISAYQLLQSDKEGYSHINLTIAHKDIITRYLNIFKKFNPGKFEIILSSYGLLNLYNHLRPQDDLTVMAADIDSSQVELIAAGKQKLTFSRAFKLNRNQEGWEGRFIEEINKSRDACLKEVPGGLAQKIVLCGDREAALYCAETINKKTEFSADILDYENTSISGQSFVSLIGLGLTDMPEALNILPPDIKQGARNAVLRNSRIKFGLSIAGIMLIWFLAASKSMDNKTKYLGKLKSELSKIAEQARPLERIEKRLRFSESRLRKKPTSLDILSELYRITPSQISLINLAYEEDKELLLKGEAPDLGSVLEFNGLLEKSSVFSSFDIKMREASRNKIAGGSEIIDFEIICKKK